MVFSSLVVNMAALALLLSLHVVLLCFVPSFPHKVFIEAYPEPTRQLNYKKLNLQRFDPGAVVRYDGGFHLVSDPIRKPE